MTHSPAMETTLHLLAGDARRLTPLADASVHLVLTSPPYPMIAMWDETFAALASEVAPALARGDGQTAFAAMHRELDLAWAEVARVLVPGGLAAINIGDAVRTLNGDFALWPNHARALTGLRAAGLSVLPGILWRKPTNAPNKFMGSGMLPVGAYVTLEHEHVLILRKGGARRFASAAEQARRRESALFWHERNTWCSDVWMDLRGTRQEPGDPDMRRRSAAFPLELALRLVALLSIHGDTVLDPFVGTGTTLLAAAATARHGVGVDADEQLLNHAARAFPTALPTLAERQTRRLTEQASAMAARIAAGKLPAHQVANHAVACISRQERLARLTVPTALTPTGERQWRVTHQALGPAPAVTSPVAAVADAGD